MKITVIYGQQHKGNTWKLTKLFLDALNVPEEQITEFFLPSSAPDYCAGCLGCVYKSESSCPHAEIVQPIAEALDRAELIIIASPCYVMGMTGQLKTLFDHFAYRYMIHRPEPSMFKKTALVISTAAGAGMDKTTKAISDSLFYWGVARIYRFGIRIGAESFDKIPEKRMVKIERNVLATARNIEKNLGIARAGIKTRLVFMFMRNMHRKGVFNKADSDYWQAQGWLADKRPF